MEHLDLNQNLTQKNGNITKEFNSILTQHEDLRRATLLKHRKVSTQLKLDMVQRQLSCLRRSHTDSETARQFYRSQMAELSSELQDLDCSLNKVERNAFYARKRLLRQYGMEYVSQSTGAISLSSSHPAIFTSNDNLQRSTSRSSLISKVSHLVSSSPSHKSKKRHFFGELRAVASLSSLNTKTGSQANGEEDSSPPSKDSKSWKAPLKFLGNLVDSSIRRKLWGSDRTKSVDHIMDEKKESSDIESKDCNGFGITDDTSSSSTSSSESNDEDEVEEIEEWRPKRGSRSAWKAPVARKISNNQKAQIDPAILAEIEEFEKMAAQYIKQHS